jgi:hypothetical protein
MRFLLLVYIKHDFLVFSCQHFSQKIACCVVLSLLRPIDESLLSPFEKRERDFLFLIKLFLSYRLCVVD